MVEFKYWYRRNGVTTERKMPTWLGAVLWLTIGALVVVPWFAGWAWLAMEVAS